jgi:hypothetical protein
VIGRRAKRSFPDGGRIWALVACLALPLPALADTLASRAPDKVAVTLYRGGEGPFQALDDWQREEALKEGLILVTEARTMDLPAGRHTLRFEGVADALIPQSAAIEGLPGRVVERNYDYALLSPGTLVQRALDQPVKIVRTNRRTGRRVEETAILRQGPDGVVLQTAGGVETLGCSGGAEGLVFDKIPAGLADKPSLSVEVDIPAPARATLVLSYLATGVNWQADYVARIHPDGGALDLTGWLTLVNASGTSFADAPTQAVAGKLAREAVTVDRGQGAAIERECWPQGTTHPRRAPRPPAIVQPPLMAMAPAAMAEGYADRSVEEIVVTGSRRRLAEQSELGDYKLYTLPEPVTVAARQTKQVAFLDQKNIAFQRLYVFALNASDDYDEADDPPSARVVLRLNNKPDQGLGKPLPSGALAVMETTGGLPAFAGEQAMRDVAVGQPFDLDIGAAMDVRARPRLVSEQARRRDRVRRVYEIDLSNAKTAPITVELRLPPRQDGFKIIAEPGQHDIRDGALAWRFPLAAGARKTVRYIVEYDD